MIALVSSWGIKLLFHRHFHQIANRDSSIPTCHYIIGSHLMCGTMWTNIVGVDTSLFSSRQITRVHTRPLRHFSMGPGDDLQMLRRTMFFPVVGEKRGEGQNCTQELKSLCWTRGAEMPHKSITAGATTSSYSSVSRDNIAAISEDEEDTRKHRRSSSEYLEST